MNNATSISIGPTVGTVAASGSSVVAPTATTTYTLTATGSGGTTAAQAIFTLTVPPPPPGCTGHQFIHGGTNYGQGGAVVNLSWSVSGANKSTLSPTTLQLSTTGNKNYTLTGTGPNNQTATQTLTVVQ